MNHLTKTPSFNRIYLLKDGNKISNKYKEDVYDKLYSFIETFFELDFKEKIYLKLQNHFNKMSVLFDKIYENEKNNINNLKIKKEFYNYYLHFEKFRIIFEFLKILKNINDNFVLFFKFSKKEIYHEFYQNFIIQKFINKTINNFRKIQIDFFNLYNEKNVNYEYKNILKLWNKKYGLFEGLRSISSTKIFESLNNDFVFKKIRNVEIYKLNDILNNLENLRLEVIKYFEKENTIIEHGLFSKFNTNLSRKTLFEKTDLEIKLQKQLHNAKNLVEQRY